MALTKKLRWQRLLSKLSYLHEENEYVQAIVKDGATDAPRMDLGSTPKELKSSNANNFYGVSTDAAPDPGSTFFIDYGVPGYIPALGKVTFFNDVAVGTAADVAQIRIAGSTLKLRADVVAS